MAVSAVKLRMLYIMQILQEETDEDHPMTADRIAEKLEKDHMITVDRKTVYRDIETMNEAGIEICRTASKKGGYYYGTRKFELPELKLLVDAVQASKFITSKKSDDLIRKLGSLASKEEARHPQRQVYISHRPKTGNETIYYNVDAIHTALYENSTITFQYTVWTTKKELVPKHGGALYEVSPHALAWDDENYYLVAYDAAAGKIKHYRVDKMKDTQLTKKPREGMEAFRDFNLAEYVKKTFGMYGGHDEDVVFTCPDYLAGVMFDRFGTDIMVYPAGEGRFKTHALVAVSPQFFGWVTAIGKELRIESPEHVKQEYREYLKNIVDAY